MYRPLNILPVNPCDITITFLYPVLTTPLTTGELASYLIIHLTTKGSNTRSMNALLAKNRKDHPISSNSIPCLNIDIGPSSEIFIAIPKTLEFQAAVERAPECLINSVNPIFQDSPLLALLSYMQHLEVFLFLIRLLLHQF